MPISALVTRSDESVLVVYILIVAAISLALLNSPALSLKFEMNLSRNSGRNAWYFLLLRIIFKCDQ